MQIAFTPISGVNDFPVERRGLLGRLFAHEGIRKGTVALMRSLIEEGWEVWVYTTSFRGPFYVKSLFRLNGVRIVGDINRPPGR